MRARNSRFSDCAEHLGQECWDHRETTHSLCRERRARRLSLSRIARKDAACSSPMALSPPLPCSVDDGNTLMFVKRGFSKKAPIADLSSGCATVKRRSALKRQFGRSDGNETRSHKSEPTNNIFNKRRENLISLNIRSAIAATASTIARRKETRSSYCVQASAPLRNTLRMPTGGTSGLLNVAGESIVAGSNTTTSAL